MLLGFRYRRSLARKLIGTALEGAVIAGALTWYLEHDRRETIIGAIVGALCGAFFTYLFQMYDDRRANRARREAGQ